MKNTTKQEIQRVWRWLKWAFAISISIFLYLLQVLISLLGEPVDLPLWGFILISFSFLLLWLLFEWIHHQLHAVKAKPGVKLLLLQVVLSLAGGMLLFFLAYLIVEQFKNSIIEVKEALEGEVVIVLLFVWLMMSILTISMLLGSYLVLHWKQSAVESQKLKKETALANYNALKSQINPHFVFNSLNTLQSLIHEDAEKATSFLEQLSEIMRYTLYNRNKEVVAAREELIITEAYLRLFKSRFGELFNYTKESEESLEGFHLVSLSLLTLVENVFKHNVLSEEAPLMIEIRKEEDYLVIGNTRGAAKEANSLGVGLHNIRERYNALGSEEVIVEDTASYFRVKIPLLNIMTYEDSNH
ncbi:sensor histidine kinase [Nafulsella turpanensis]|uniref:sensor histidine kinase n=1 Tax=Nafulsella turpanensis TaxID=1265690 RepID=UPI00034B6991|nr:sensor histidine kinase [Nafulsella turpanensis]